MRERRNKILVFGAKGMLGTDIVSLFSHSSNVIAMDIEDVDITKKDDVIKSITQIQPDIVINCAGYTDVDGCELNKRQTFSVNAEGVKNIANGCQSIKAKLVHFSTDYIFDGEKNEPYTEDDIPNPLNIYGQSKLMGEKYIENIMENYIIVRTEWLFGRNGKNFVSTILRLAKEKNELRIVNDQIGSPTYTVDLAYATKALVEKNVAGIFNVANSGHCSWYEFAKKILESSDTDHIRIFPISSKELQRPAQRPRNSILDCNKFQILTSMVLSRWEVALEDFLGKLLGSKTLLTNHISKEKKIALKMFTLTSKDVFMKNGSEERRK